jgi:hypothetical protein
VGLLALATPFPGIALPRAANAQAVGPRVVSPDSVTIAAGAHYEAGALRRFFLGNTYRDYWGMPIRVPVLSLRTYGGGLEPLKEGGGMQTKSLRLGAPDGSEFVFRLVPKAANPPDRFRGTLVDALFRDQLSAMYPAAPVIAAPIVEAAGVLHATPEFAVMADDSLLGKYRETFVGQLAIIEQYPTKPDDPPGFGGAAEIIDSDQLIPLLDSLPTHRVDDHAFLVARLTDFILGDLDRHLGNWKWARFGKDDVVRWLPIARDRDHAFHHYDGLVARLASKAKPNLTTFDATYPGIASLSRNARTLDRRLLAGLEKPAWDSLAAGLERRITDAVIDSALERTPPGYRPLVPSFAAKLRARRDSLGAVADRFYAELARVVDVQATSGADFTTVTYRDGGFVDVDLRSGAARYFRRRFDPRETREIRVYLHDGDDSAVVTGNSRSGIVVRVVGGNGLNTLIDSTRHRLTRFYDRGRVRGVSYGPVALRDTLLDRRPWVDDTGSFRPPSPDYASSVTPTAGVGGGSGLGLVPRLGIGWTQYGFGREPYASHVQLVAEYSLGIDGYRFTLFGDRRRERSPVHYTATARMSDFEVINFHGLGNDTDGEPADFFHVRQRQWMFHPAIAHALGRRESDVTFGPVIQYSTTDSSVDRYISRERPYGFGNFGQAGLRLGVRYDARDNVGYTTRGFLVDATASVVPALWDVESAFSQLSGSATTFFELALPTHPVLAFRAGGWRVWGEAPFDELAFIGGRGTVRGLDAQRYAGDASIYGTSELRVPVARLRYILPLDVGVLGFVDAGRVYVDGASPTGWHAVAGGGLWFGILDQATGFSVSLTSSDEKRVLLGTGLRF